MWRRGVSARRVRRTLRNKLNSPSVSGCGTRWPGRPRPHAAGHGHGAVATSPDKLIERSKKKKFHGWMDGGRPRGTRLVSLCVRLSDLAAPAPGRRCPVPDLAGRALWHHTSRGWGRYVTYLATRRSCIDRLRVVVLARAQGVTPAAACKLQRPGAPMHGTTGGRKLSGTRRPAAGTGTNQTVHECIEAGQQDE